MTAAKGMHIIVKVSQFHSWTTCQRWMYDSPNSIVWHMPCTSVLITIGLEDPKAKVTDLAEMYKEAVQVTFKHKASLLSSKRDEPYSTTIHWGVYCHSHSSIQQSCA